MQPLSPRKKAYIGLAFVLFTSLILGLIMMRSAAERIKNDYRQLASPTLLDRSGQIISIQKNARGYYARYLHTVPAKFTERLLAQEDHYFYFHPGINPISTLRALGRWVRGNKTPASSTITQQLVKIILQQENERSLRNKVWEAWYALGLELFASKKEILLMYENSVFLGNTVQGLGLASELYFGKPPELLADREIDSLLLAFQNPTNANPFTPRNERLLQIASPSSTEPLFTDSLIAERTDHWRTDFLGVTNGFELTGWPLDCQADCTLTIDLDLTKKLRELLQRNLQLLDDKKVDNGAIVVIKLPENQLLAMIGSPDPTKGDRGYQINLARAPRPIGSTIKPLLYLKGFEDGLRPYSLVDDQEYKYEIGSGFAFYPKNYDYQYHGRVSLHYALSNSLNVPSVKVLEYIGLEHFYDFLTKRLGFVPIQPLERYQLGIALGQLEMDLLQLTYYFTLFGNNGTLLPLSIRPGGGTNQMLPTTFSTRRVIAEARFIQLINRILSDRLTGIDQFGLASNLNLPAKNYAVKTGTSRDFHDSWTVGYTPDFVVGVWMGNSDNTPMDSISGTVGAGRVWNETMNMLLGSPYNRKTPFNFDQLKNFKTAGGVDFGLPHDDHERVEKKLIEDTLILSPHRYDTFSWEPGMAIPLRSREPVEWLIDTAYFGKGSALSFYPQKPGTYEIRARNNNGNKEMVSVKILD